MSVPRLLGGVAAAWVGVVGVMGVFAVLAPLRAAERATGRVTRPEFADLPPVLQASLSSMGVSEEAFPAYLERLETATRARVAAGNREHLIYYALQSNRFTERPRIEPAVSAFRFVSGLQDHERERLLEDPNYLPKVGWPPAERTRVDDLIAALRTDPKEGRLAYFNELVRAEGSDFSAPALYADYVRVARFLYTKEFLTGPSDARDGGARVARLYQSRPYSSDTQIESGFCVHLGLATLRDLDPSLRFTRVLLVGPGLDLAPRTDLVDMVAPQSYQPFAVADALFALSLAQETKLYLHSIDVNQRVVDAVRMAARRGLGQRGPGQRGVTPTGLTLHFFTGVTEASDRRFSADFQAYLAGLGLAIGNELPRPHEWAPYRTYVRSVAVRSSVLGTLSADRVNILTERIVDTPPFDIVIATNVLTYFDDQQLRLALANMAAMLRPGGYLLHNESRPGLAETAGSFGLPVAQMRTAIVRGPIERPLYDAVWLHHKIAG